MPIANYIRETMNSKGASVIRKMFEEGAQLKAQFGEDNVFDFSIGNPDLEPPKEVTDYIQKVANEETKGCHGYMPNAGYMSTRQAMADKVAQEQGCEITGKHVVMSVGAAAALNVVFKSILTEGDEVVVPCPYFAEYNHYVNNYHGKLIPIPAKDDMSLDIEAIARSLSPKTAAVLINSPNNPSGKIYSEEQIKDLAHILRVHGEKVGRMPYLICDEPYRAITYGGRKVAPVFPVYDSAVIVSSFAKNLSLPGERIGYIATNPKAADADEFIAACIFSTRILGYVNAPAFFQRVVEKTWNAPADYSSYEKRCEQISKVVYDAGIEYITPEGAFYLFCKVPARKTEGATDDFTFCNHLKKYNILCAPGTGFGCPGHFRISYCVAEKTILNSAAAFKKAMLDW